MFPARCDKEYLLKTFKNIEPVIDVEIHDIYTDYLEIGIAFHYTLFNKKDKNYVNNYIKGIGGTIQ